MKKSTLPLLAAALVAALAGCRSTARPDKKADAPVRIVTLDPGHFHAALVQKNTYPGVDATVHVYAPKGPDLQQHLERIDAYNTRTDHPTHWKEQVYAGDDFLKKMLTDRAGNVLVLAGNNQRKTDYISQGIAAGFHVLADKPMAIDGAGFEQLRKAFAEARQKKVLLYDIMTERFEVTSQLQRAFSQQKNFFVTLEKGTPTDPAVIKESVHHLYKMVSGKVLTRPAWFLDTRQQGEGIVDVTTHLVDLVQWACFPEEAIDYQKDINMLSARHWPTAVSLAQFQELTKEAAFPDFLQAYTEGGRQLRVMCNGEMTYTLRGVHARVGVTWAYRAPEGGGDTHYSLMRGSRARLVIRQGQEQQYRPTLYLEPAPGNGTFATDAHAALAVVAASFPGVSLKKTGTGYEVVVPEKYHNGHEAHFGQVTERFLQYLRQGRLPAWEVPNMLSKYYTTTQALQLARQSGTQPPR